MMRELPNLTETNNHESHLPEAPANRPNPSPEGLPLLERLSRQRGMPILGVYRGRDTARLFDCGLRAIQDVCRDGRLTSRDLPGHGRFLPEDLEAFLRDSVRQPSGRRSRQESGVEGFSSENRRTAIAVITEPRAAVREERDPSTSRLPCHSWLRRRNPP